MKVATVLSIFLAIIFFIPSMASAEERQIPVAPQEYIDVENPVDVDDIDEGFLKKVGKLYKRKCKKCHGTEGDGKGSAADDMEIEPTAFTAPGYLKSRVDGQLYWILEKGSANTEMKAYGPGTDVNLSEEELWQLIAFIRHRFTR
jgi:cytochrome c|tara:strand:+ start:52 stop:486 length:435 start_codon:yes stop_codon:yes gene_type:complete